jgi:hypothetical protein
MSNIPKEQRSHLHRGESLRYTNSEQLFPNKVSHALVRSLLYPGLLRVAIIFNTAHSAMVATIATIFYWAQNCRLIVYKITVLLILCSIYEFAEATHLQYILGTSLGVERNSYTFTAVLRQDS